MKDNYQKCIRVLSFLICVLLSQYSVYSSTPDDKSVGKTNSTFNTPCAGTSSTASQGAFSTGYTYSFATVGTDVTITFTMLDTDKVGVVAYLWQQTPFAESAMPNVSGLTFAKTITGQTPGATITYAVKFAYAGGMAVTEYFSYVVGDNCGGGGPADTVAPTGFTASVGTITASSVQLLLNGTDDSGNVIYTITYGTNTATVTGISGAQQAFVINNLAADTDYTFNVTATDAAGNTAANNPIVLLASTPEGIVNTPCAGTATAAQQGSFSTGYSYEFETVGNNVNVTITMLDTDKVGVVAYLWQQTPFSETPMTNAGGLTFTGTLAGHTPGATIGVAVKFAYAGGLVVTQYINYVVGENCGGGSDDTEAPAGFTATVGTIGINSVELLLNSTDDSGDVIYTITYNGTTVTVNGVSGEQESVIINGLNPETAYTFTVTATDAAGNAAANNPLSLSATTLGSGGNENTQCAGTSNVASQGAFSTGYSYEFETVGNNVNVTITMLDTDKVGVVAYLWQQTPFSETPMTNAGGLTFTGTLAGQTPGATIGIAVKFAYAGGLVVTQYINYVVGENCGGGSDDTEAPAGFTATVGTMAINSVELLLNSTDDSGDVIYTITYNGNTVTVNGVSGDQESVIINGLNPETAYTFTVTATDAAGNAAANNPLSLSATTLGSGGNENTPCAGTSNVASEGAFSTGYSYEFETVGNNVNVTITMLDTDKVGVVAYLWQQTPFAETPMTNAGGLTFTGTLAGQTPGATIGIAVKFAYAGGLVVTQYINYVVGENCGGGSDDTEAPADFTATVGNIGINTVELILNGTDNSGDVIYTITYNGTTIIVNGTSGEQESVIINNLAADTEFTFTVTATDAAGNAATNNPIALQATTLEDTNTECAGVSAEEQQGTFSTGYNYSFETVGNDVNVTFELLDTDKVGVVAYLWQETPFVETPMVQGEGLSFSATSAGQTVGQDINFAVKFAYAGGLSVTKYFTYTVGEDCTLGLENPQLNASIKLYPNPANNIVHIDSELSTLSKIEIYSIVGSKVLETTQNVINIESLSEGLYLVKIYSGNKVATKKLIVE